MGSSPVNQIQDGHHQVQPCSIANPSQLDERESNNSENSYHEDNYGAKDQDASVDYGWQGDPGLLKRGIQSQTNPNLNHTSQEFHGTAMHRIGFESVHDSDQVSDFISQSKYKQHQPDEEHPLRDSGERINESEPGLRYSELGVSEARSGWRDSEIGVSEARSSWRDSELGVWEARSGLKDSELRAKEAKSRLRDSERGGYDTESGWRDPAASLIESETDWRDPGVGDYDPAYGWRDPGDGFNEARYNWRHGTGIGQRSYWTDFDLRNSGSDWRRVEGECMSAVDWMGSGKGSPYSRNNDTAGQVSHQRYEYDEDRNNKLDASDRNPGFIRGRSTDEQDTFYEDSFQRFNDIHYR